MGGKKITTIAAMVPGAYIHWEGALALNTDDKKELNMFNRLNKIKMGKYDKETSYIPVMVDDEGRIQGVVMLANILCMNESETYVNLPDA